MPCGGVAAAAFDGGRVVVSVAGGRPAASLPVTVALLPLPWKARASLPFPVTVAVFLLPTMSSPSTTDAAGEGVTVVAGDRGGVVVAIARFESRCRQPVTVAVLLVASDRVGPRCRHRWRRRCCRCRRRLRARAASPVAVAVLLSPLLAEACCRRR